MTLTGLGRAESDKYVNSMYSGTTRGAAERRTAGKALRMIVLATSICLVGVVAVTISPMSSHMLGSEDAVAEAAWKKEKRTYHIIPGS